MLRATLTPNLLTLPSECSGKLNTGKGSYCVGAKRNERNHVGINTIKQEDIFGGNTVKDAANIFVDIISGKGTEAQNNVVCANAGLAIATSKQISHKEGFEIAKESLFSENGSKLSMDSLSCLMRAMSHPSIQSLINDS